MLQFKGMKILLIAPRFFGYESKIIECVHKNGGEIFFYDDRLNGGLAVKILLRLKLQWVIRRRINRFFDGILSFHGDSVDHVLIISPEGVSRKWLLKARKVFSKAVFTLYMWDSFDNKPAALRYLDLFHNLFSFDLSDVERHADLTLRPLFFSDCVPGDRSCSAPTEDYDLSFIGTIHGDRFSILRSIENQSEILGLKFFKYFYLQNKILLWKLRFSKLEFLFASATEFRLSPLDYNTYLKVSASSKAIVDINSSGQSGLTMRTLEVVGQKKKLITTNDDITKYTIFDSNNILVIDRNNPVLDVDFFERPYTNLPDGTLDAYSIDNWLIQILGIASCPEFLRKN